MEGFKHLTMLGSAESLLVKAMILLAKVDDCFTDGEARLEQTDMLLDGIDGKIDAVQRGVRGVRAHSEAKVVQGDLFADGRKSRGAEAKKDQEGKGAVERSTKPKGRIDPVAV